MDPLGPFSVAALPEIRFGPGRVQDTASVLARFGRRALLVTGHRSFVTSPHWGRLLDDLRELGLKWRHVSFDDEPSPELVDRVVAEHRAADIQVVAGIGGGSALDAAKAIAGLLLLPGGASVLDYLEGVGRGIPYSGPALPWVALPTTAGTGSEATKNAVLSRRGPGGFKKSFRDGRLVARVAIVDPQLLATCPKALIAANGMDAFTQLLESYVSCGASPFTDALALSGLEAFRDGLWPAWTPGHPEAPAGYDRLAYASLLSGITLAQAGLGSVHGLASPLGAFFPIPHGVVCGTLVAEATAVNIRALRERLPQSPALARYARVAQLLTGQRHADSDRAADALVKLLRNWVARLGLPRLSQYGMGEGDLERVVACCRGGSMRTNPLVLEDIELRALLRARL
jgi:alcohol dehydrogenase class IV